MGYDRHHAILVTAYDEGRIRHAHTEAGAAFSREEGAMVAPITDPMRSPLNGWWTFAVFPDGSKEGWPDSGHGDKARSQFMEWLESQRHGDGSSPYDWVEVQYGDDEGETLVTRDSDAHRPL